MRVTLFFLLITVCYSLPCGPVLNLSGGFVSLDGNAVPSGTQDRTISLWFRVESLVGSHFGLVTFGSGCNVGELAIGAFDGGAKFVAGICNVGAVVGNSSATLPFAGFWHHMTVTYSSGTLAVSVNGSNPVPGVVSLNTVPGCFRIGSRCSNNAQGYSSNIHDLRIWNRVLSLDEIKSVYLGDSVPSGLVGQWLGGLDASSRLIDSVGSNLGVITGSVSSFIDTSLCARPCGDAINASNGYVNLTNTNIPRGASPRTISLWFNAKNTLATSPDHYGLVSFAGATPCAGAQELAIGAWLNGYFFATTVCQVGNIQISNTINPFYDTWHHFTITYDGTTYTHIVNASNLLKSSRTYTLNTDTSIFVFGAHARGLTPKQSLMSDIAIWDRVLSIEEIFAVYSGGAKPTTGLVGFWPGHTNENGQLVDMLGTNNGTFVGDISSFPLACGRSRTPLPSTTSTGQTPTPTPTPTPRTPTPTPTPTQITPTPTPTPTPGWPRWVSVLKINTAGASPTPNVIEGLIYTLARFAGIPVSRMRTMLNSLRKRSIQNTEIDVEMGGPDTSNFNAEASQVQRTFSNNLNAIIAEVRNITGDPNAGVTVPSSSSTRMLVPGFWTIVSLILFSLLQAQR